MKTTVHRFFPKYAAAYIAVHSGGRRHLHSARDWVGWRCARLVNSLLRC
jgi:hypothetical protein